jgi:hypothetical protein
VDVELGGQPGGAYAWIHLPLQTLFIAWSIWSTREVAAAERSQPSDARTLVTAG